ncbi:MAG: hypothetical protein HY695_22915 [Deltaproteobacteria bacterium]|nr:hypothetical protein [Deltaproteobacteria bacterium]
MREYHGGIWAPPGFYLERTIWKTQAVPRGGQILEGAEESTYVRLPIPPLLMAFLIPIAGALYVILLPLIAGALIIWLAGSKAWKAAVLVANRRLLRGRSRDHSSLGR